MEINRSQVPQSPIERGVVINWDDMERIMRLTMCDELRVAPEEYCVLLTEPPLSPKGNRERMVELMFEQFHVQGTYLALQALLATYASGRCSALTLDSGSDVTHVIPVYEGHTFFQAIRRVDIGGRDVTDRLASLLQRREVSFATTAECEDIMQMKEKLCYVASDYAADSAAASTGALDKPHQLPDGRTVTLGQERIECTEALFHPTVPGLEDYGLQHLLTDSLKSCSIDVRRDLSSNIVLSGGNTMFPGISERLQKEMVALAPPASRVRVIAPPERKLSVWIGGSILASLSTFQNWWITRQEYEESGPGIVHRKCT
jgi:actin beta/gamma 1